MEFDFSWMREKNGPDGMSNFDTEKYEVREVTNNNISLITRYVDDVNQYFSSKGGKVWLHWSFCPGFDEDIKEKSDYFNVWGVKNTEGRKVNDAKFLFNGPCSMFRDFCTKENLDKMEKDILERE